MTHRFSLDHVDSDRDIASTVGSDERDRTTCRSKSNLPQLPFNRLIIATCFATLLAVFLIVSQYNSFEPPKASLYLLLDRTSRIDHHLHQHSHQWKVIHDTLKSLDKEITGNVYFFNDNKFDKSEFVHVSQVWVASVAPPYAVIEVASERDVQIVLRLAVTPLMQRYSDLEFRVRSGGHNKAGYSTVASGIVLSLARLNKITNMDFDTEAITLQPAVLVEQFMQQVTLPYNYSGVVGFCKQVAESGFVLGGGFGLTSRLYGMGMDNVLSMRIVLADGSVQQVSTDEHSDLFWALRGAGGGSFGVVTEMRIAIHKSSPSLQVFSVVLSAATMASFLQHIGELDSSNALPGNFVMLVDVYPGDGLFQANILWTGQDDDEVQSGQDYVAKLLDEDFTMQLPSDAVTHAMITWSDFYGPNAPQPAWGRRVWAAGCWCGFLLPEQNTDEVWQEIMSVISAGLQQSAPYLMPDVELWGGAMHDKAGNETAFPYRSAIYDVGVLLTIPDDAHEASKLFEYHSNLVDSWWPKVAKHLTGSYVNYPMRNLKDYPQVYWADNLERLVHVKNKYDPDNVFKFPMSVPTSVPR